MSHRTDMAEDRAEAKKARTLEQRIDEETAPITEKPVKAEPQTLSIWWHDGSFVIRDDKTGLCERRMAVAVEGPVTFEASRHSGMIAHVTGSLK
jgi:hypothetical protein